MLGSKTELEVIRDVRWLQTLALNSSVLSGVVGRGFRKRFDWDFRRED